MKLRLTDYQTAALCNPFDHFCMYGGVGSGKSATGSHFALKMMDEHPNLSGFIGANSYDQLSQTTLREFFKWLNQYGVEFVIDRQPPRAWQKDRKLKDYRNVLTCRVRGKTIPIYTRVLSEPDSIRGMEFSWYWLDELRDTTEYAHDMVLGRMRESEIMNGFVSSTTNGEGWDYKRFTLNPDFQYGSMNIPTQAAVNAGIIPDKYYKTLRATYSLLMAMQELDALHVNIGSGRAYHAAGPWNRMLAAPWGDVNPNPDRPLIVGCDFNFAPAPCVWMVGQIGPNLYGPRGELWSRRIHWFKEISHVEMGTRSMVRALMGQFPGFPVYRVFGDMSGNVGTTSNAGETDFNQMGDEFAKNSIVATIDALQLSEEESKRNPFVKDRVENMNSMLKNALGEVLQTYSPIGCPLFDNDMKMVGWKQNVQRGRGKLDDGGDNTRTHASDGAGYAIYKLFPPMKRSAGIITMPSALRGEHGLLD